MPSPTTARLMRTCRLRPTLLAILGLLAWLLLTSGSASAASTYTVSGTADSTAPCSGTSCPSLRSAVAAAAADPGSTVKLGAGVYKLGGGSGDPIGGGPIESLAGFSIVGAGPGETEIEQTDGQDGVFLLAGGTVTISGVTITGGRLDGSAGSQGNPGAPALGAGIDNDAALTLNNVTLSGNIATGGAGGADDGGPAPDGGGAVGGIFNTGSLTLIDTQLTRNAATGGAGASGSGEIGGTGGEAVGGLLDEGDTAPTVLRSSAISGNTATGGAGGSTDGTSPGSTPLGGYGAYAVGGLLEQSAALTLNLATITANTAVGGAGGSGTDVTGGAGAYAVGGVWLIDTAPPAVVGDSTLSGNIATGGAGGGATSATGGNGGFATAAFTDDANGLTVTGATFAANIAIGGAGGTGAGGGHVGGVGGGVLGGALAESSGGPLTISTSTFSGDSGHGGVGGVPNGGGNGTCGAAIFDNGKGSVSLTADTLAGNVAASSTGGGPDGPGGGSEGGGICFALAQPATASVINSTIAANSATGAAGIGAGSSGEGRGGGLWNDQNGSSKVPVTLEDDTLAQNSAPTSGGDVYLNNGTAMIAASTIFAYGVSGDAATSNCYAPTVTDMGHNFEASSPAQCGLSAANSDLVGATPLLGGLAANGGATETMALNPASPEVGAGGDCPGASGVDQRGLPRPSSQCDIGAFELQAAPTLTLVTESNSRWREGSKQATLAKAKPPKAKLPKAKLGTIFSFALNEPAAVVLTFSHVVTGRRVHRRCVAQSRSNRHKAACRRTLIAGKLSFASVAAGAHAISFQGRFSGRKKLAAGVYSVTVSATNVGTVTSKPLRFTVT